MKSINKWYDSIWNPFSGVPIDGNKGKMNTSVKGWFNELELDDEKLTYPSLMERANRILINPTIDLLDYHMGSKKNLDLLNRIVNVIRDNSHLKFMIVSYWVDTSILKLIEWPNNLIIVAQVFDEEDKRNLEFLYCIDFPGQCYVLFEDCVPNLGFVSLETIDEVIINLNSNTPLNHWDLNWISSMLSQAIADGCGFSLEFEPKSEKGELS
ncbi:DUF5131 family protein [Maribellus sp. YY47]|uniref:DUF5131 family protein n=1 Tax=Maribellus sp. YY47 TaxID=2929486 RepID=UPI0020017B73|nr:DUF5131 family protein [Maribellus sp. YY47]MCK3683970.1 hypothetical protein [Maribellus sp. YY47]